MPQQRPAPKTKTQRQSKALTYIVGFLAAFCMPAFVTAIAPVSWVSLVRDDGQVAVTVRTCLLLAIPYRVSKLYPLRSADSRIHAGEWHDSRGSDGRITQHRAEDEGFLVLHGGADEAIAVSISPVNLEDAVRDVNAFIGSRTAMSMSLLAVANWKFSVIAGLPLTLLAGLYAVGSVLGTARCLWRLVKPKSRGYQAKKP